MTIPFAIKNLVTGLVFASVSYSCHATIEFHVAPDGNDGQPGTRDQPFATPERAREAVRRQVASGLKDDVVVSLHEGTYHLAAPLVFGPGDGGTEKHAVTWTAWQGGAVTLSGGRPVGNWKRGEGDRWVAELPAVREGQWFFRQLYVDGIRLPRGRFPAKGFLKIKEVSKDSKSLKFTSPLPDHLLTGQDAEVVVVQNWSLSRERIASHTTKGLTAETQIGWVGHGQCRPKPGMSAFLEHAVEFVTQPGQWHLDRERGLLTYQIDGGETPDLRDFIAPVLEQLVRIEGTRDQPVRNLEFKGLTFAHSSHELPATGYGGIQACYHGTTTAEPLTLATPVAVELINARSCRITDCRLHHLGGSGIGLGAGCRDSLVTGCEIHDVGGTGVNIGHMPTKDPLWADWKDPQDVPTDNEVSNCHIHHCGQELWGAHGIFDAMTSGTRIRHNEVSWLPYGGIATGFVWNTERTSQENCLIEFNQVYEVMHRLNDSGCIYTLGNQPGSTIRGNLLHGVRFGGYAGGAVCNNGIFMDEGSKGFHFEDNVIYDVDQARGGRNTPVRFNRSQRDWQTWKNNTIQFAPDPPAAAAQLAGKAGLEPEYRERRTTFKPSWTSLQQYECPEWFRDAKYGIFMHWGVNTVPAFNGHYGRYMYIQEDDTMSESRKKVYGHHVKTWGHPSKFGYKDFIPLWKAEKWDPDELATFYKKNGVRYIVPVAVHCDNFDNYDSSHQEWNSVRMGPKRDIIGEWKKAAARHGLRFGVSSHVGDWARRWYDQTADQSGPLAGVPYDVMDPRWDGLYGTRGKDRTVEPEGFPQNWFLRTKELVDKYQPDILYFDGRLPYGDLGLQIASHFYNENTRWHAGRNEAVLNVKHSFREGAVVHDIEKGQAKKLRELPWQTDTTINTGWFYQSVPDGHGHELPSGLYLDETILIDTLVDIVSKNGNLLLNVGQKADGTLPDDQRAVLQHIGDWLKLNGEAIYETRPWLVYGEGPTQIETGFNTQHRKPWTQKDIRFTTRPNTLYATVLDWPGDHATITIKSATPDRLPEGSIKGITMLGHDEAIPWKSTSGGLQVTFPGKKPCEFAHVLKIELGR